VIARLSQHRLRRAVARPTAFAAQGRAIFNITDNNAAHTAEFLRWFDHVEFSSARLHPLAGTTRYNAFQSLINATKALNPNVKFGAYVIAYEHGGQISFPGTISRSGNTLTINLVNITAQSAANVASTGNVGSVSILVYGLEGPLAVYNGTWPLAANLTSGQQSIQLNVAGNAAAESGPTSGDAAGIGLISYSNTVAWTVCNKLKDNPSWYLYKRGTSGRKTAWTTLYNATNMNITDTCDTDAQGRRWVDYCAEFYYDNLFAHLSLDWVFIDNYMDPRQDVVNDVQFGSSTAARQTYDFLRDGNGQLISNATVLEKMRAGCAAFANKFKSYSAGKPVSPNLFTVGNYDNANGGGLPSPLNAIEYSWIELVYSNIGDADRSGLGGVNGFSKFYAPGTGVLQKHVGRLPAGGKVVLGVKPLNGWADKEVIRFGACTAWLHGDMVCIDASSGTPYVPDEFKVGLGLPIEPPPTAATASGLWVRRYENGLIAVNPGASAAYLDLTGTLYKRINGTDDPAVNSGGAPINGGTTIPARSARVFVINDPGL